MADVVERLRNLTRPIVGIEHRTAQEVFDLMVERVRRARLSQAGAGGGGVEPWAIARKVVAEALEQGGSTEAAALVLDGSCDGWADVILAHRAILAALAPSPSAGGLPAIPDDDADFTPELARKIIVGYQRLLRATPPATPVQPTASMEAICNILMDEIGITETAAGPRISSDDIASAARRIASLTPAPTQGAGA